MNILTVQKVKTQTVERECLTYTTVWLHEGKESDRGSEGDQREERASAVQKQEAIQKKKSHSFSARQIVFAKEKGVLL